MINNIYKRNRIYLILLALAITLLITGCSSNNENWTIEGDTIYVDNADVRIEITPHTLYSDGSVIFNLTSKQYTGNVDVYFGFNTDIAKPQEALLFNPQVIQREEVFRCPAPYWFNYSVSNKRIWCWNNVTSGSAGNGSLRTIPNLISVFDYDTASLQTRTAVKYYNETKLWQPFSNRFSKVNRDFGGMNTWYYANDLPVQANAEYSLKVFIKAEQQRDIKYWVAVKPSSETLEQAITNDHFYYLDPWINASKTKYVNITSNFIQGLNWKQHRIVPISLNATTNGTIGFTFNCNLANCNYSLGWRDDLSQGIGELQLINTSGGTTAFYVYNTTAPDVFITPDYPDSLGNTSYQDLGTSALLGNERIQIIMNEATTRLNQITSFGDSAIAAGGSKIFGTAGQGLEVVLSGGGLAVSCANPVLEINSDAIKRWRCSDSNVNLTREVYPDTDYFVVRFVATDVTGYGGNANRQAGTDVFGASQGQLTFNGTNVTDTTSFEFSPRGFRQNGEININTGNTIAYWLLWQANDTSSITTNFGNTYRATMRDNMAIGASGSTGDVPAGNYMEIWHGVSATGDLTAVRLEQEWQRFNNRAAIVVSEIYGIGNNPPSFTTGYPQINSTDGQNATNKDLTATFRATEVDLGDVLTYNITWYQDNITNFTFTQRPYTSGAMAVEILNNTNLTKTHTWKAMIALMDNGTTIYANTSELLIINSPPSIPTLNLPADNLMSANWSINISAFGSTDNEGDTINYEFYLEREVNPPTTLMQNNTAQSNVSILGADGRYFWRVRANDGQAVSGYTATRSFLVDRRLITNVNSAFVNPIFAGSLQYYSVNVTINQSTANDINATLIFDGNIYNTSKQALSSDTFEFTTSVTSGENETQTLRWNFTINELNGTRIYNTSYTMVQQISVISIYDCSATGSNASSMVAFNFSFKEEPNQTILRSTFEGSFLKWVDDKSINSTIALGIISNVTNVHICSSPASASYNIDGQINYYTSGFDPRQYYFRNHVTGASVGSQNISLYLLQISLAEGIQIYVQDPLTNPLVDYLMEAKRKNIGNDTYTTIAMGDTNSLGYDLIFLRQNDAIYQFKIYDLDNNLVYTSADTKIVGTTLTITINPTTLAQDLQAIRNTQYTLTFDNNSKTFNLVYNDPTNSLAYGCLKIQRRTLTTDQFLYDQCNTGASGSLSFHLPDAINNSGVYTASFYAHINPDETLAQIIMDFTSSFASNLGLDGVWFWIILAGTLGFIGMLINPILLPVGIGLGTIISMVLQFISLGVGGLALLIIAIILLAIKLKT